MINQNLGKVERYVRLALGIGLAVWIFFQPSMGILEWIASVCSLFLILNFFFSRCYAWDLLGINTCGEDEDCHPSC